MELDGLYLHRTTHLYMRYNCSLYMRYAITVSVCWTRITIPICNLRAPHDIRPSPDSVSHVRSLYICRLPPVLASIIPPSPLSSSIHPPSRYVCIPPPYPYLPFPYIDKTRQATGEPPRGDHPRNLPSGPAVASRYRRVSLRLAAFTSVKIS